MFNQKCEMKHLIICYFAFSKIHFCFCWVFEFPNNHWLKFPAA